MQSYHFDEGIQLSTQFIYPMLLLTVQTNCNFHHFLHQTNGIDRSEDEEQNTTRILEQQRPIMYFVVLFTVYTGRTH